jgi:hypothetical protein
MSSYGNPDRPNRYERAASDMIYKVERAIVDWLKKTGHFPGPGIKIEPDLYYDDDSQPLRFLEMYLTPRTSIRVAVQRNIEKHSPWTCYWTVFANGRMTNEGSFDANGISQIGPELTKKIIGRWEYTLD